jgi:hypothetical protein
MDILNFISWIRGGRQVTTVDPAKTLLPVGLKDPKRDDGYLAGAISVEDLVTQITPTPSYKVFTALLTQSGGDDLKFMQGDGGGDISSATKGTTVQIFANINNINYSSIGAPNSNVGTYFILTQDITLSNLDNDTIFSLNIGAPVVTVLENTIGNVWFTYNGVGSYSVNSDGLFTTNKSIGFITFNNCCSLGLADKPFLALDSTSSVDNVYISSASDGVESDDVIQNTPIEIRVYL